LWIKMIKMFSSLALHFLCSLTLRCNVVVCLFTDSTQQTSKHRRLLALAREAGRRRLTRTPVSTPTRPLLRRAAAAAALRRDIRRCTGKGQRAITSLWRRWLGGARGAKATRQAGIERRRHVPAFIRAVGDRSDDSSSAESRALVVRSIRLNYCFHLVSSAAGWAPQISLWLLRAGEVCARSRWTTAVEFQTAISGGCSWHAS